MVACHFRLLPDSTQTGHSFFLHRRRYGNALLKVFCSGSLPGTPCLAADQSARVIDAAGELFHAAFSDIVADIA